MNITLLGTGTSQGVPLIACNCAVCRSEDPRDKRLRSSVLIETAGKNIVIDAGPDFRQQMLTYQVEQLRAILITHEHVDHIFGLDDIRSYNWVQKQPMEIFGEKRVEIAIKRIFNYVFDKFQYPGIPQMNLTRIDNAPFLIDEINVIPIRGFHHKLPVYGFRIGDFAYLTDMNFVEPVEKEKLKGLKVLVVNALRKEEHISHYNLEQAVELIDELEPGEAYLTHLSHQMGLHKEVSAELPSGIYLAYDGLKLTI